MPSLPILILVRVVLLPHVDLNLDMELERKDAFTRSTKGSTVSPASHADSGPMNEVSCTCHYICYFCFQYLCLCLYLLCCWYIQAELKRPYFE
jgi:hypothetical protein